MQEVFQMYKILQSEEKRTIWKQIVNKFGNKNPQDDLLHPSHHKLTWEALLNIQREYLLEVFNKDAFK